MKKLWPFLFLFHLQLSVHAQLMVAEDFNDSIDNIIEEKESLYYIKGHHGHIWSLVFSEKGRYIMFSGNTRNNDCRIDTISINVPILKWGLDTLALYCQKMQPVDDFSYRPFYERLVLLSSRKEIIFDCTDTDTYSGTDCVAFNKKLTELKYFMYWFATPIEIREKLPRPL